MRRVPSDYRRIPERNDTLQPMEPLRCRHCETELVTSREQFMQVCYECRRTALLTGRWPEDDPILVRSLEPTNDTHVHS